VKKKVTKKKVVRKAAKKKTARKPARKVTAKKRVTKKKTMFKAPAGKKDDLKRIRGIGSVMEKMLNRLGITTFAQISKFSANDVTRVTDAIKTFPDRIHRDKWINQAKLLSRGGETEFSKRVDKGQIY